MVIARVLFAAQLTGLGNSPSGLARGYVLAVVLLVMALLPAVLWPGWAEYARVGGGLLALSEPTPEPASEPEAK